MKEFVLAFPLTVPKESIWAWMVEKTWIAKAPSDQNLYFKGISFDFRAVIQDAHPDLVSIFSEHRLLSAEEIRDLASHRSVLFLIGTIKDKATFRYVQEASQMLLKGGALGIVYEHCGAAHTAETWLADCAEDSMSGWINWVLAKNDLRTLGLDAFQLPDLITAAKDADCADELYALLLDVAENWFFQDAPIESGHYVTADDGKEYLVRKELKSLFPKTHPQFNPDGAIRLVEAVG